MSSQRIIVVGGGVSGLIAARELSRKFEVVLIEYRDILGGRIRSTPLQSGEGVIEAGAEFIHGNLPITMKLLKEANLDYVEAGGAMLRKEGNEWKKQDEMIEGWDKLIGLMKDLEDDMTMQQFLDLHFHGDHYAAFRKHVQQFVQGFDVAEPERVSVKSLYREWEAEEENYRVRQGYSALVRFLEGDCLKKGCRIITGQAVKQVDWQQNKITAYTNAGENFNAEKILITVPVSILQMAERACAIQFNPEITEYVSASFQIGFGTVIKIILDFGRPFWKDNIGFVLSDETIPTWWTQHPVKNNLLTGWAGGPMADGLAHHSDEELLDLAITSLSRIFDLSQTDIRNNLRQSFVFNWKKNEETSGAYSYATPDSPAARKLLTTPLANSVYFAGEGLYDGKYSGTVEAALISGQTAAELILGS